MSNYLVVGGSSGMGLTLVDLLKNDDHTVISTYNKTKKDNTGGVSFIKYDVVNDELDIDALPEAIDGLVYCPGTINLKPFTSFSEEDFVDDYRISVTGAVKTIQKVLPGLKKADHPSIVMFSTVAVQGGFNYHSLVSSSKGAIEGLTRALAAELAPKIRVNAIAPSLTDTPLAEKLLANDQRRKTLAEQNPFKRVGTTEDIANLAHFLLKPEASYITGQVLHVDGGMSIIKN